jgi:hypothetical protein
MGGSILISLKLLVISGFYLLLINFSAYTQTTLDLETLYGKPIESTGTIKDYYAREFIIIIRVNNTIPNSPKYEIFPVKPLEFISRQTAEEIVAELFPKSEGYVEKHRFTFYAGCNETTISAFENENILKIRHFRTTRQQTNGVFAKKTFVQVRENNDFFKNKNLRSFSAVKETPKPAFENSSSLFKKSFYTITSIFNCHGYSKIIVESNLHPIFTKF